MNWLCRLVGHKPPVYAAKGWRSPGEEYGSLVRDTEDGIGRVHAEVRADCARCSREFMVARVHLPRQQGDIHD